MVVQVFLWDSSSAHSSVGGSLMEALEKTEVGVKFVVF